MFLSSTSSIWPLLKYFSCFLLRDVTSNAVLYEIRYFLRIWSLTGLIRLHTISAASLVHQTNSFSVVFSLLLCPKLQYRINLRIMCPICCILMVISNPTWDKLGLVFNQQVVWQFTVKWPSVFKPCSPPQKPEVGLICISLIFMKLETLIIKQLKVPIFVTFPSNLILQN